MGKVTIGATLALPEGRVAYIRASSAGLVTVSVLGNGAPNVFVGYTASLAFLGEDTALLIATGTINGVPQVIHLYVQVKNGKPSLSWEVTKASDHGFLWGTPTDADGEKVYSPAQISLFAFVP